MPLKDLYKIYIWPILISISDFISLSNKQERMEVYINKMFIWYLTGQTGFWLLKTITVTM